MENTIYLTTAVGAMTGLWILWSVAIRGFVLDYMRERIFTLRFSLFELGVSGDLPFESDTYRTLETLLNGLLRYAHRFSILTYALALNAQREARKDKGYVDVAQQIELGISRLDLGTKVNLEKLLTDVHHTMLLYVAFSSLFMLAIGLVLFALQSLGLYRVPYDKKVTAVIEREAYWAESRQQKFAMA